MGDAFGGGVGAMRRAESVVHVDSRRALPVAWRIRDRWLPLRHGSARFSSSNDCPRSSFSAISSACTPMQSGEKPTFSPRRRYVVEQNAQPLGHRLQAHLRIRLALGTPKVGGQNQPSAMPQRVLDGGQRLADAGVVHDATVVERNVEVDPHENALVVQRKIANG